MFEILSLLDRFIWDLILTYSGLFEKFVTKITVFFQNEGVKIVSIILNCFTIDFEVNLL
jgi:hypothetical protein